MNASADRPDLEYLVAGNNSLAACFQQVVQRFPTHLAVGSGSWQPDYAELNGVANRLARSLLKRRAAVGDRVAILMGHDASQIACMLGALKAGTVVVMLNPDDRPDRLRQILDDAQPRFILTNTPNCDVLVDISDQDRDILIFEEGAAAGATSDPELTVAADATAFLAYTSGSTGRPKGVMQPHSQHSQNAVRLTRAMDLSSGDHIALLASLSGSQGVHTLWSGLLNGATLYPFPTLERGAAGLADWMSAQRITVYTSSASLFRTFMRTLDRGARLPLVRAVRIASEMATAKDFAAYQEHFVDGSIFIHTLSATETSTLAHLRLSPTDHVEEGRLPVGHAAEGIEILLLDEQAKPVDRGVPGEIIVRSKYISKGYWRNQAQTGLRFSEGADGVRTFQTGDLGKINDSGLLEVIGRKDARVKIRGYSVDISAVEEAVLGLAAVQKAAVCVGTRPNGDNQLVAYVERRHGQDCSEALLRRSLRESLPHYMVPSAFILLTVLPLTANGKIDRAALRLITPAPRQRQLDEHWTTAERQIAEIWAKALEITEVGRQDNFFELGGDSLVATEIAVRVHAVFGIELDLSTFSDHPTLEDFAREIVVRGQSAVEKVRPIVPVSRDGQLPLSLLQERIWHFSRTPEDSARYAVASCERIVGPLDRHLLHDTLKTIVDRHEILRTTFDVAQELPHKTIHAQHRFPLHFIDLAAASNPEECAKFVFKQEACQIFDLSRLPLINFSLVRVRQNEHWLLTVFHHIILDGSSKHLLLNEIAQIYDAKFKGSPSPLPPPLALQYADFAAWQREAQQLGASAYNEAVSWWSELFAAVPPPMTLPFRRAVRLSKVDPASGNIRWQLASEISQRLSGLGRQAGATAYLVWLAALSTQLAAEMNQSDIVIGTYVSNRTRFEMENMLGLFANLAAVRFRCDLDRTFQRWLIVVRDTIAGVRKRSAIPYEQLRMELHRRGVVMPDIQVIFNLSQPQLPMRFAGLEVTSINRTNDSMPWGFSVNLEESSGGQFCSITFDANCYDPADVQGFSNRFRQLLESITQHPDVPLCELTASSIAQPGHVN